MEEEIREFEIATEYFTYIQTNCPNVMKYLKGFIQGGSGGLLDATFEDISKKVKRRLEELKKESE